MKDGYYLSTYIDINPLLYLIKRDHPVSRRHDQNISLWKKECNTISLIHYWEIERISGQKKHHQSFFSIEHARNIINNLLSEYNLSIDDMQEIWGTPGLQTEELTSTTEFKPNIAFHALAHLYSGMLCESDLFYNSNLLCLVVDCGPDNVLDKRRKDDWLFVGSYSEKGKIKGYFPVHSAGPIWAVATTLLKLPEGSLMALASASKSEYYLSRDEIEAMAYDYINNISFNFPKIYTNFFEPLIEKINALKDTDAGLLFNYFDPSFSIEDNRKSMIMKIVQKVSLIIMEHNIQDAMDKFGFEAKEVHLSITGGFALNCPTNSWLMEKYGFKGFVAPPCVSDTGISMGIALYAFYKGMSRVDFSLSNAYYGDKDFSLDKVTESDEFAKYIKSINEYDEEQAVSDIIEAPVVWLNGAAEMGPRALGNRSILADARDIAAKNKLNVIKQRQWWRPVAPIILMEHVNAWFVNAYESPYMLHTFCIREDKKEDVPAIVHQDLSARVQTIKREDNEILYDLILEFYKKTGIPIICNTSLNDKGEPIIDKISQALNFALRKGIKVVYINGSRVELKNHDMYTEKKPKERTKFFDIKITDTEYTKLIRELNPYGLSDDVIKFYYEWAYASTYFDYDLTKENDVKKLQRVYFMCKKLWGIWSERPY